jgi:hypothetical protein
MGRPAHPWTNWRGLGVEMRRVTQHTGRNTRSRCWGASSLLLLLALPAALAGVVKIERLSPPPSDVKLLVPGLSPAINADGRFLAFTSFADSVVAEDTNHQADIFVRDRQTGKIELVSRSVGGAPANGGSVSSDGCLDVAISIHGTGTGFDPLTQQPTGNLYQFNDNARATKCGEFCPASFVNTVYTRLIGQGATPNDYVRMSQIVVLDEQCLITTWLMEISNECRG